MGIKGLMTWMGMNGVAIACLVACFSLFCAIVVWTFTRSRAEMDSRARLCLDEDDSERHSDRPTTE